MGMGGVEATLGGRGAALWRALSTCRPFNAAELVVLEELCRMADRLDKLDEILSGEVDTWLRLESKHEGRSHTVEVVLDDGLSESRQIAVAFQRLAASLNLPAAKAAESDGIGDLAARRAARLTG